MRKPVAEAKPRLTWRFWARAAVWLGLFAGVAWGGREVRDFLLTDPRFELPCQAPEHIEETTSCADLEIHGAKYTNRARVQSVFAADYGKSVFRIPLAERRRHLLAVDWVRTASITRAWPNRIVVTIGERQPVAFAKLPVNGSTRNWMALVDQDGVLMKLPARARFRLPVLSGVNEEQTDEERRWRVKAMQHLLEDLGPQAKDISEINAASLHEMRVIADVNGQGVELWLGDQHYRSRYVNFLNHYADIRTHSQHAGVFDLRLDDRILAR